MTDAATREGRCEDRLARAGLRATRARRVVLAQLQAAGAMLEAIALHRQVGLHDARISLPTVYRTLREFERGGIVRTKAVAHGRMQWQLTQAAPRAPAASAIERLARQAARLGYRLVPEPA